MSKRGQQSDTNPVNFDIDSRFSPSTFAFRSNMSQSQFSGMQFFSFDSPSGSANVSPSEMSALDLPVSPTMSGNDMLYGHVDHTNMWNGSEIEMTNHSANADKTSDFPGFGKTLSEDAQAASRQFGQITPPSENDHDSKDGPDQDLDQDLDHDFDPSMTNKRSDFAPSRGPSDLQKPTKTRTASGGGRAHKRARTSSNDEDTNEENTFEAEGGVGDNRREKYREKNRVAAAKCRAKKKGHVDHLEETHRTQSMLNTALRQTEKSLRDELSFWRTQALQHSFCNCQSIQDYNMRKAQNLAAESILGNATNIRSSSIQSASSMAPSPETKPCMMHPGRAQSTSGASPAIALASMDVERKLDIAPSELMTSQHHTRHASDSALNQRYYSSTEERDLRDFVNDVVG